MQPLFSPSIQLFLATALSTAPLTTDPRALAARGGVAYSPWGTCGDSDSEQELWVGVGNWKGRGQIDRLTGAVAVEKQRVGGRQIDAARLLKAIAAH